MPGATGTNSVFDNDHGNLPSATLAAVVSLASGWFAFLANLPEWATRFAVPVCAGVTVFTANKLIGKWIDRRWPDRKRRKGDTGE